MDRTERITYTELALQAELDPVIQTVIYPKDVWEREFISNPGVDPLNLHKPYGLTSPQFVKGTWTIGVSAEHLIKPLEDDDDTRLGHWITYWAFHTFLHLVVLEFAVILGDVLTLAEIEAKVDELFESQEPALYSYGGEVRILNPT